jgi:hypothetical protein
LTSAQLLADRGAAGGTLKHRPCKQRQPRQQSKAKKQSNKARQEGEATKQSNKARQSNKATKQGKKAKQQSKTTKQSKKAKQQSKAKAAGGATTPLAGAEHQA